MSLQKKLRPLTPAQIAYAHSHYENVAYYNSRRLVWCQSCGYEEKQLPELLQLDIDCDYICPACGKHLTLEKRVGKSNSERYYSTYATAIGDWQVFRTFLAKRNNNRGFSTHYELNEVYQNWINTQGEEFILSIEYTRSPLTGEKWKYDTPLDIPRQHNYSSTGAYIARDMFDISGNYIYPRSHFSSLVKRNGWKSSFLAEHWLSSAEVCKLLLRSPDMEMVAKTQPSLFIYLAKNGKKEVPHLHAVKVCNRNAYCISEPNDWIDYITQLQQLGLDTHNAHYVCPANLVEAHAATLKRLHRLREKAAAEVLKNEIKSFEKSYSKHIASFAAIKLCDKDIVISPLSTVQEVYDEGVKMHHCVFTNKYYAKRDVLLLSAKANGIPLETIELSLRTLQVVQSRGRYNQPSPRHFEIINIINKNIKQIQLCQKRKSLSPAR